MKKIISVIVLVVLSIAMLAGCTSGKISNNNHSKLIGIELSKEPDKTSYFVGDKIDVQGGKLDLIFENGSTNTIDITLEMITNYELSAKGNHKIDLTYGGYNVNFSVVAIEKIEVFDIYFQTFAKAKKQSQTLSENEFDINIHNLSSDSGITDSFVSISLLPKKGIYIDHVSFEIELPNEEDFYIETILHDDVIYKETVLKYLLVNCVLQKINENKRVFINFNSLYLDKNTAQNNSKLTFYFYNVKANTRDFDLTPNKTTFKLHSFRLMPYVYQ